MNGDEFLKWLRRETKRRGLPSPVVETNRGKGSHVTVYVGDRMTVLKDRKKEISKGLRAAMIKQLGLD